MTNHGNRLNCCQVYCDNNSLYEWQKYLFKNNEGEVVVIIPDETCELQPNYFDYCTAIYIFIHKGVSSINCNFYECNNLKKILVQSGNINYTDIDGVLYSADRKRLIAFPNCWGKEYHVENGTEIIAKYAFKTCHNIQKIYLPYSIKKIDINAFYRCEQLTDIYTPNEDLQIGSMVGNHHNIHSLCHLKNKTFELQKYILQKQTKRS